MASFGMMVWAFYVAISRNNIVSLAEVTPTKKPLSRAIAYGRIALNEQCLI